MIKQTEFVRMLKALVDMKTKYCNKYPYNIGYVYEDGSRSFDCWNMIKSLLNGYDITNSTPGYKCPTLSVTGDVDGRGLLNSCSKVSKDFSILDRYPAGTYLFIANSHSGIYVGDTVVDGKVYNVVECTASWGKKVLYSYVDSDGSRRPYKGGRKNGQWTDFGLLDKYVEYEEEEKKPAYVNNDLTKSVKPKVPQPYLRYWSKGERVEQLQQCLNFLGYLGGNFNKLDVDGVIGPQTLYALRDFQRRNGLVVDGVYGPKTHAQMDVEVAKR